MLTAGVGVSAPTATRRPSELPVAPVTLTPVTAYLQAHAESATLHPYSKKMHFCKSHDPPWPR